MHLQVIHLKLIPNHQGLVQQLMRKRKRFFQPQEQKQLGVLTRKLTQGAAIIAHAPGKTERENTTHIFLPKCVIFAKN